MFKLYDVVRTKRDYPQFDITTQIVGTVVDVLNNGEAYTVEFVDQEGNTIEKALFTDFTNEELLLADN